MRARLAVLLTTAAVILLPTLPATADSGGRVCTTGTNWDNAVRDCR